MSKDQIGPLCKLTQTVAEGTIASIAPPPGMIGRGPDHRRGDMAKKKSDGKRTTTADETALKPVRVELTDDVHRMLRKLAADDAVSMAAFARETVERVVREEFKRRGLK